VETFTLALRLTGNEEDARDVVQDAYIRSVPGPQTFRGEAQFSTWRTGSPRTARTRTR
jgi:RNA polymerase sigma-70 factor (ECF subfamily)